MADETIWVLVENTNSISAPSMVIGAYRSYDLAVEAVEAKRAEAGYDPDDDGHDEDDEDPWWDIEPTVLRGEAFQCMACGRADNVCDAEPCPAVKKNRGEEVAA